MYFRIFISYTYRSKKYIYWFSELKPYNIKISVCCPPDTNTPGFQEEQKTIPEETKLISDSAGLFQPEVVAK